MGKWILLTSIYLRTFLLYGTIKANGVILMDIVQQLNTSTSLVAWAFSLQNGIAYLLSPFIIILLEYTTGRPLCIIGGILCGTGYIYCGCFLDSIWQLFLGLTVSGIGFSLANMPSFVVLQHYFDPHELPLIISSIMLFDFVGVATVPPIVQVFRQEYGLRNALILVGAIAWNTVTCGVASKRPKVSKFHNSQLVNADSVNAESAATGTEIEPAISSTEEARPILTKLYLDLISLFHHNNIGNLLAIHFLGMYTIMSWALFMVSLGKSLGLTDEQSVALSTAGGIGGFVGRLIAFLMFKFEMMNPYTFTIIPCLITGVVFIVVVMCSNFFLIAILIFISGITLGLNGAGAFSLVPSLVCPYHYRQTLAIVLLLSGFSTQLAGFISGIIQDIMGSTIYVFLFNVIPSFLAITFAIVWACDQEPNLHCQRSPV